MEDKYQTNQALWDSKVAYHLNSEMYDMEAFKSGRTSLKEIELEALGDVNGKSMLHLQCHFGQDTLSWARMGAMTTGVDISPKAIEEARKLSKEINVPADFVVSNILELKDKLDQQYDIIFTSYGTICWLHDLNKWAEIIHHFLKPSGIFYIAEFHPIIHMIDWDNYRFEYPYFDRNTAFEEEEEGTYADRSADIKMKEYFWLRSTSETMTTLLNQGLELLEFKEFDWSPYNCFPKMTEVEPGKYVYFLKEEMGNKVRLPHVFSFKMRKRS